LKELELDYSGLIMSYISHLREERKEREKDDIPHEIISNPQEEELYSPTKRPCSVIKKQK